LAIFSKISCFTLQLAAEILLFPKEVVILHPIFLPAFLPAFQGLIWSSIRHPFLHGTSKALVERHWRWKAMDASGQVPKMPYLQ
jgi:hypothetical protein